MIKPDFFCISQYQSSRFYYVFVSANTLLTSISVCIVEWSENPYWGEFFTLIWVMKIGEPLLNGTKLASRQRHTATSASPLKKNKKNRCKYVCFRFTWTLACAKHDFGDESYFVFTCFILNFLMGSLPQSALIMFTGSS